MLTRIVRMEFAPQHLPTFLSLFEEIQPTISQFPGCKQVALHQDPEQANVLYTLSKWESIQDLEHYRSSDFFRIVWPQTKALFSGKPQAYSLVPFKNSGG